MDYHFIAPSDKKHKKSLSLSDKTMGFLRRLLPVFLLAAILPAVLYFVSMPPDLRFSPRADSESELRIWLEPAQVISSPNRQVTLSVKALFESESLLIPSITVVAESDGLEVGNKLEYLRPFKGQVELGEMTITTSESGSFVVDIPTEKVEITAFTAPLTIITSPARIQVK